MFEIDGCKRGKRISGVQSCIGLDVVLSCAELGDCGILRGMLIVALVGK